MAFFKDTFRSLHVRNAKNIEVLDGLRAISMLLVLFYHAMLAVSASYENPQQVLETVGLGWLWIFNGDLGVDLFFVISGFLIAGILLKEGERSGSLDLKRFYAHRVLRILPAYYFVLLLYFMAGLPNKENMLSNVLFFNNFLPGDAQAMNWSWSIAVEEQFYFVFPIMLFMLTKLNRINVGFFWGLLVVSFLIRGGIIASDPMLATRPVSDIVTDQAFYYHRFDVLYDNLYSRFGCFVAGIIAAFYHVKYPQRCQEFLQSIDGKIAFVLAVVVMFAILFTPLYDARWAPDESFYIGFVVSYRTIFAMAAIYIMMSCIYGVSWAAVFNVILKSKLWIPFAQLSYSLYLVHPILMFIAGQAVTQLMAKSGAGPISLVMMTFTLGFVVSLILSLLIYVFVERPFMALRNRKRDQAATGEVLVSAS
ncbi:MAG: acyltransferase [Pseudomonadales bacterium]|nr:acyltransferase [Pseudomonadales bacterium]